MVLVTTSCTMLQNSIHSSSGTLSIRSNRTGQLTIDWFKIGKGVHQGCIFSPCLFNLYAECITWNVGMDESEAEIKITVRNINNLRYADDTTLKEELKSLLMKVKENEKVTEQQQKLNKTYRTSMPKITKSWSKEIKHNFNKFSWIWLQHSKYVNSFHLITIKIPAKIFAVQFLSYVWLFAAPWTAAHQASLSFTIPRICSNSCPLVQYCHPTISSSVTLFSCPQSFPALGSFPVNQNFLWNGTDPRITKQS